MGTQRGWVEALDGMGETGFLFLASKRCFEERRACRLSFLFFKHYRVAYLVV